MTVINPDPNQANIILQTKNGRNIPNVQSHETSPFERNQYSRFERNFTSVKFRSNPNPAYNCHGLTFASRRTAITDNPSLYHILEDDRYEEIQKDNVLPGDVILYFSDNGDIEHSGIVVSEPDRYLKIPDVVSKWGRYKEVIHPANNCPYTYNVKYYRVR